MPDRAVVDESLCVCGHPRSAHYTYILNGLPQERCKACDPFAQNSDTLVAMETDSYVAAMYYAADHTFQEESNG